MSTNTKNMAKASLAGVAAGVSLGAASVLLSDKKRRDDLADKAKNLKDQIVSGVAKMTDDKTQKADEAANHVGKVVKEEKEKISKSLN